MRLSPAESRIVAILAIFETGKPDGYAAYGSTPGDTGGLSLGLFQASLNSGNAGRLLRYYKNELGGEFINPHWVHLADEQNPLLDNPMFKEEWEEACLDPRMREAQDYFFYEKFVRPAVQWCQVWKPRLDYPLSQAVIADSRVHGSLVKLARLITDPEDEFSWIHEYLVTRRNWLATHENQLLHRTVYRPDFFLSQVDAGNWGLDQPFECRGFHFA